MTKSNDSTQILAILTHILGLLTSFLGPLIVFLASNEVYVKKHAKHALNWQISLLIYSVISSVLVFIFIGWLFLAALSVMNVVFCILAAVKAGEKEFWKYPLSIPFFKVKK